MLGSSLLRKIRRILRARRLEPRSRQDYSLQATTPLLVQTVLLVQTILEHRIKLTPEESIQLNRDIKSAKNLISSTKILRHREKLPLVKNEFGP